MAKNTSILLGKYFENYISKKVKFGDYSSENVIVKTLLRML